MTRIGTIRHASKVGYKRMFNDLHTASFEIPADDDADNDLCETVHGIVDIVDGDKSVGKYRICDQPESDITGEGEFIQYELEHVIAFCLMTALTAIWKWAALAFIPRISSGICSACRR